ncbi:cytochrome B562 [Brenneria roseae subsp. americana]|uniref:Cytochrome B562 n=1 Tax=Brenneria roseae subsp. americana TaxID=1508507 RepID=A0A2U1TTH1_9GAMM|nr:cytochrome b562 [Brenneria roseae]PWC12708.1 cytochrome B562 [Brenneria roseae subsp. americana]PWC20834.1 cytochrome B562 [Brenneria roseae subsp. roseae]
MNRITKACFSVLLAGSLMMPVLANATAAADMRAMQQSYISASKADDAATLKAALTTFRENVTSAKTQIPPDFANQSADDPDRKAYVEGLDKVLQKIDDALTLADEGKLKEAKASISDIALLRNEYHKKLRG